VESGEGIESYPNHRVIDSFTILILWNPVKELKGYGVCDSQEPLQPMWNPVKELKDDDFVRKGRPVHAPVESGEGIER